METARDERSFTWHVRVYFEDTDAGGIVYYANFLRFFERCRTEWLRALGIEQARLAERSRLQFVVVHAAVDYLRPARLDDQLAITARIGERGRAYLVFEQQALRGMELLARASVKVACVDSQRLLPARLPADLLAALEARPPHQERQQ